MKIAIISSGVEPLPVIKGGSVDTYSYYLAKNLADFGEDVTIYCHKESKLNEKIKVIKNPFPSSSKPIHHLTFNSFIFLSILKKRRDFDIIHTNTSIPTIFLSKIFKNIVFTSHSAYWWRSEETHKRQIEAVKKARAVIAISRDIEKVMKKYNRNVFYVPNGVDTELFSFQSFKKRKLSETILSVGSITEQKGLIYLAKAMISLTRKDPEIKWIHIGPGNDIKNKYFLEIMRTIEKAKISRNVEFLGRVPLKKLIWFYRNATLFCLPSLWEGMPLVLLEAMSCGLPIVSTTISGVRDVVTQSEGILVNPKNYKQLSSVLFLLLKDEKSAELLGRNARIRVEKNFSWTIITKKIKKIYETILE